MKKLLAILTFAVLQPLFAATLSPVQLLNPAGSTTGQAIISNGPSAAPTWGSVSAVNLAPVAANTVLGNFTGSSAAPTAFAVPSCSTANSALRYTSGTGLSCGTAFALTSSDLSQFASTTSAQLAGVLSDETGTGAAVFGTSPALGGTPTAPTAAAATNSTQLATTAFANAAISSGLWAGSFTTLNATGLITPSSTNGIKGTATNDNANAGSVGEIITGTTSTVSLTTGVTTNVTSISLTAGDWDVSGTLRTNPAGSTTTSSVVAGVTTTSGAFGGLGTAVQYPYAAPAGNSVIAATPVTRLSLPATTTVYLDANVLFSVSTLTADGFIRARRAR